MEKPSSNTLSPFFSLVGFAGILLFHGILIWVTRIPKFYSRLQSFLQSQLDFVFGKSKIWVEGKNPSSELLSQQLCFNEKGDDGKLLRGDVEMVMEKLGMFCNGDKLLEEISVLFEEKEPSLEEVKDAFDVFDENRDGFIDARELQRILRCLGFREGSEMKDCERMIRAFDENGDGRIDFNEFVKFMENSFC